jgi:hypothetical protein
MKGNEKLGNSDRQRQKKNFGRSLWSSKAFVEQVHASG